MNAFLKLKGSPAIALVALALTSVSSEALARTPHLDAVESALQELSPDLAGHAWQRTTANAIAGALGTWLLQTPNCWGIKDCAGNQGSYVFAATIQETLASAETLVDITTLAPYPDGMYQEAVVEGLRTALKRNPKLTVRILAGSPPFISISRDEPKSAADYWELLQRALGPLVEEARITVTDVVTQWGYSWNHAKIIAVDGKTSIVGGHNFWTEAYGDVAEPVSDVSMQLTGPAAVTSHRFADALWAHACANADSLMKVGMVRSIALGEACLDNETPSIADAALESPGTATVLSLGGMGLGMHKPENVPHPLPPAEDEQATYSSLFNDYINDVEDYSASNPDVVGIRALVASAEKRIFLSQQDLIARSLPPYSNSRYDARLFDILADKLAAGVHVRIVLSSPGASPYSEIGSLDEVSEILVRKVKTRTDLTEQRARSLVCGKLQLAAVRFAPNVPGWESGKKIANHPKVVMVDDAAFYIGSRNMYPTTLQEFGYMVEDKKAAAELNRDYTVPLWKYSRESAAIDFEAKICKPPAPDPRHSQRELFRLLEADV